MGPMVFLTAGESGGLVTALETGFTSVASDILDAISGILPIALPILGGVLVITVGIRLFKSVAKK